MRASLITVGLLMALATGACSGSSGGSATNTSTTQTPTSELLPQIRLGYSTGALIAEVALTPAEQATGLGYRDVLGTKSAMLFDMGSTKVPQFWMKGMRFPLDMVWITEDKKIADITANVPPQPGAPDIDLKRYSPSTPVRYVLEINAGAAERFGMAAGQQLDFTIPPTLYPTPAPSATP